MLRKFWEIENSPKEWIANVYPWLDRQEGKISIFEVQNSLREPEGVDMFE
jgi:hypothetical protein